MYKNRKNIIRHISALTMSVLMAANGLTAFAGVYEEIVPGDVNGDGKVNATDISIVAANVKGKKTLDEKTKAKADINGDGYVNVSDVSILAAHVKGKRSVSSLKDKAVGELALDEREMLKGGSKGKLFTQLRPAGYADGEGTTVYRLRDAKTNEILWSYESKDMYDYLGMKEDGTLVLDTPLADNGKVSLFAPGSTDPVELPYTNGHVHYDEKNDIIYVADDNVLYKLNDNGDKKTVWKFANNTIVLGFDFDNGIVFIDEPYIGYSSNSLNAVSLTTGESFWRRDCAKSLTGIDVCCVNGELILVQTVFGGDDYFTHISVFDPLTGEPKGFYKIDKASLGEIVASDVKGKCILRDYRSRLDQVTVFDPETVSTAKVNVGMRDFSLYGQAPVDENTWAVQLDDYGSKRDKAVTIDTSGLNYKKLEESTDLSAVEEYTERELGEELQEQRNKADALEEKYGVTILIGNEVLNVDPNGMDWTSVEQNFEEGYPEELDHQLDVLDEWMDAYPDGFFGKFKAEGNEGGYRIILIDEYLAEYNDGTMASTSNKYDCIDIAVTRETMNYYGLKSTMDHETWHAVECLVGIVDGMIDDEAWNALNPEDFVYWYDEYDGAIIWDDQQYSRYLLRKNNRDNSYFIRDYSWMNSHEDRATIMEWLKPGSKAYGIDSYREEMELYPRMKAKIDFMGEYSKQYFGYVYWEKMFEENEPVAQG